MAPRRACTDGQSSPVVAMNRCSMAAQYVSKFWSGTTTNRVTLSPCVSMNHPTHASSDVAGGKAGSLQSHVAPENSCTPAMAKMVHSRPSTARMFTMGPVE